VQQVHTNGTSKVPWPQGQNSWSNNSCIYAATVEWFGGWDEVCLAEHAVPHTCEGTTLACVLPAS